jgi:hypothetical protein
VDLSGLLRELDTAILPGGYIEYGAAFGYASRIGQVLEQVEELTAEGFPDAAIEAAEHALRLLEEAFGQVDDSDGELGTGAGDTPGRVRGGPPGPGTARRAARQVGAALRLGDLPGGTVHLCRRAWSRGLGQV